jgi:hypothetical protein
MKPIASACVATLCASASVAVAEPCVSATFERPLPNATRVVTHVSDVPSAQFPVFWQEGILEGFRFKILASREGTVRPIDNREDWVVSITCHSSDLTCELSMKGAPPQTAVTVANKIGQCLVGAQLDGETTGPPPPGASALETLSGTSQTERPTCGSAAIDEVSDIAIMQRLLIMAGEDPGPVDGVLGALTFSAMEAFAAGVDRNTSISDVIALLDARLCANAD